MAQPQQPSTGTVASFFLVFRLSEWLWTCARSVHDGARTNTQTVNAVLLHHNHKSLCKNKFEHVRPCTPRMLSEKILSTQLQSENKKERKERRNVREMSTDTTRTGRTMNAKVRPSSVQVTEAAAGILCDTSEPSALISTTWLLSAFRSSCSLQIHTPRPT